MIKPIILISEKETSKFLILVRMIFRELQLASLQLQVESSDRNALNKLVETVKTNYNERAEEIKKHWGGSSLGSKSQAKLNKQRNKSISLQNAPYLFI